MPTKLPLNYFKLGHKLLKDGTTSTKWVRNFINLHEIKLQKWAIMHRKTMCLKFSRHRNNNRYHLMLLPIYLKFWGTENCAKSTVIWHQMDKKCIDLRIAPCSIRLLNSLVQRKGQVSSHAPVNLCELLRH